MSEQSQQPAMPTAPEAQPVIDPQVTAPQVPVWHRRPVQLLAAAVVVAAGIGTYFAVSSSPSQTHVRGTLRLGPLSAVDSANPGAAKDGDTCEAGEGYSDISAGTTVTVGGSTGQTLAVGALSSGVETGVDNSLGTPMGFCVFSFDVAVPSGQSAYTVTISHRGTQTFTPDQVAAGIELTLGE